MKLDLRGTDVAVESAGSVLVSDDTRDAVGAIELSRASYRRMIQNLVWATGYNPLAIAVAAVVLTPHRPHSADDHRRVAMSLSTIVVAAAQLLEPHSSRRLTFPSRPC